jgi:hypothetical protein
MAARNFLRHRLRIIALSVRPVEIDVSSGSDTVREVGEG